MEGASAASLSGQVVVVTGAASGFGRAFALEAARLGFVQRRLVAQLTPVAPKSCSATSPRLTPCSERSRPLEGTFSALPAPLTFCPARPPRSDPATRATGSTSSPCSSTLNRRTDPSTSSFPTLASARPANGSSLLPCGAQTGRSSRGDPQCSPFPSISSARLTRSPWRCTTCARARTHARASYSLDPGVSLGGALSSPLLIRLPDSTIPIPSGPMYTMAKHGVLGLFKSVYYEAQKEGIK